MGAHLAEADGRGSIRLLLTRKSLTRRVLGNAGWASAAMPLQVGLGIVQTAMLARMLGPEGIGAIALFGAICGLFAGALRLTSSETALVYVSKALAEHNEDQAARTVLYCYASDVLTSVLAWSAIALSALCLPRLLSLAPGAEGLLAFFGLTVVFGSPYWISHALLRVANRFSWTFYQSVAHSTIKTLAVAFLFLRGGQVIDVVILLVAMSLFDTASLLILARLALRASGVRPCRWTAAWWKVPAEIVRFQWMGYGRQLTKLGNGQLDTLAIGYITNPVQVGFYRSGKQICAQVQLPAQALLASLFPEYSRLFFSGDMVALRRLVLHFTGFFLALGIVSSLSLWFGADLIIRVVLGERFLPAADVIRLLMISSLVLAVMSPIYTLPAAVGRGRPALTSAVAATIVQVVVIFLLVPRHGALGAAWASVAYTVTWAGTLLPSIAAVLSDSARRSCPVEVGPDTQERADVAHRPGSV